MKIPNKIKMGGSIIIVNILNTLDMDLGDAGSYCPRTYKISINSGLSKERQYSTFLHEVVEAANDKYDIGLKHHQINLLTTALNDVDITVKEEK